MYRRIPLLLITLIFALGVPLQTAEGYRSALNSALPAGIGDSTRIKVEQGTPGRVVMVLLDRFRVADLTGLPPNLNKIASGGAVALMNDNTAAGNNPENTYVTIGAGAHLKGYDTSSLGFESQTKLEQGTASDEYYQRTGIKPPPGSLVHVGIARLKALNGKLPYTAEPGAMGKAIRKAGYKTAALGNSDSSEGLRRQVLTIAMDDNGLVDYGKIGSAVLKNDMTFVGGLRTDYQRLLEEYKNIPAEARLTVIDLGDLSRLYYAQGVVFKERMEELRGLTISRVDSFLGSLMREMNFQKDLLLVVVPTSGDDDLGTDYLTPIFAYGAGINPGYLSSPTARRAGVVLNTDIAPTVLEFLGITPPVTIYGRSMQVAPGNNTVPALQEMNRQLKLTYEARPYLQKGYIFCQLILLVLALISIFWRLRVKDWLKPFLLAVMAVPLVYLLLPLLPQPNPYVAGTQLIGVTVLITVVTLTLRRCGLDPFIFICLATAGTLLLDTWMGSPLQKTSILGYDPIVGARFYGMGNEYMGILIGSLIVGITSLYSVFAVYKKFLLPLTGAVFMLALYTVAAPQLGTNVGGTIACAAAFLTTFLLLAGIRFKLKTIMLVAAGVMFPVAAFILFDSSRPVESQSHIGRTAAAIANGGFAEIGKIIVRKSEINIKLIKYTIWSRIFLASLGSLALLFYRPTGVMAAIKQKYPYLYRGFIGVIVGSIVALIFNDSGIVAAATTMVFAAPPLIYLVLGELEVQKGNKKLSGKNSV